MNSTYRVTSAEGNAEKGRFSWDDLLEMVQRGALDPDDFLYVDDSFIGKRARDIEALWDENSNVLPPHLDVEDVGHPETLASIVNIGNIIDYFENHDIPCKVVPGDEMVVQIQYRDEILFVQVELDLDLETQVQLIRSIPCGQHDLSEVYPICNQISSDSRFVNAFVSEDALILTVPLLCGDMAQFAFAFERGAADMHHTLKQFE